MTRPRAQALADLPHRLVVLAAVVAAGVLALVAATTPGTSSAFTARVTNDGDYVTVASTRTCASEYARVGSAYATYPLTDALGLLTAADTSGNNRTASYNLGALLAHSTSNACVRDTAGSTTFNGATYLLAPDAQTNPQTFSLEIWFRTTNARGVLVGFNASRGPTGSGEDRHLYLDSTGRLVLGISTTAYRTLRSSAVVTDGAWHQAVATFSPATGAALYLDGRPVATADASVLPDATTGYWRLGAGDLTGWPNPPSVPSVIGQLGQAGIWYVVLSPTTVAQHYAAGT